MLRPPIAQERVEPREGGLVRILLGRAFSDGTVPIDMDPLSLLVRLAASVPPPRYHSVKYAGVLARTFALDVLACPTCKGRLKLLASVTTGRQSARFLSALGEPTTVPARSPSQPTRAGARTHASFTYAPPRHEARMAGTFRGETSRGPRCT